MAIDFSKGISVASGFSLQAKKPLDVRVVAQTLDDLNELINQNAAYAGLIVYVEANKAFYKCVKAEAGGSQDVPDYNGCWLPFLEGQAVDSTVVHFIRHPLFPRMQY